MSNLLKKIQEILATLPSSPGVYFFRNATGEILYIGKANSLKSRVSSYFNSGAKNERLTLLVQSIANIDYVLALSEKNALALEANLVKKYKPRFNILLKDDKSPPYIKIKITDDYPAIEVTRIVRRDGAKYFGPYFGGIWVNDVVNILKSAYKIRTCTRTVFKNAKRECLDYHIDLCLGVCQKREEGMTKEDYRERLEKAIAFLKGKDKTAYDIIHKQMLAAAEKEEFERAITYKEKLATLEKLQQRELTDLIGESGELNLDAYSIQSDEFLTVISQVIVRGGKLMGVNNYSFETLTNENDALMSFLVQYYSKNIVLPEAVLIDLMHNLQQCTIHNNSENKFDTKVLEAFLETLVNKKTEVAFPQKGRKKSLVLLARENALEHLEKGRSKEERELDRTSRAADDLAKLLGIKSAKRIECYDISNISGTFNVASRVVFENGMPDKKSYRHYKIKTVEGADDFASMSEVIGRRFRTSIQNSALQNEILPSLIVIDGGRGQLNAAIASLKKARLEHLDIIGLAEKEEEIYLQSNLLPIKIDQKSNAMHLLIRVRDEAHRFALKYHKKLREKI